MKAVFKSGWVSSAQDAINKRDKEIDELLSKITKRKPRKAKKGKK